MTKIFLDAMREPLAVDSLANDSAVIGFFGDKQAVVARVNDKIVALNALCTHLDCTVGFNKEDAVLECPCHGSLYTLEGKNLRGPAIKPLALIKVEVRDNKVWLKS